MTRRIVIATILGLCIGMGADAQTFTQRLQKSGQGDATVTVHHDKAIDDLVNGARLGTTVSPVKGSSVEKGQTASPVSKKQPAQSSQEKKPAHQQPKETVSHQTVDTAAVQHSSARTYKVTGFRVQAYAGGNSRKDRQKADQIGNQLRELFPSEQVYVHFYSPRWICRMGNYRTYEEALQQLQEVKRLGYEAATIVKGKITVQY